MAECFSNSYFKFLPPELLILILRKIETVDLVQFSEAYGCDYLLGERQLIRKIDLYRQYSLGEDLKWLRQKVNLNYVTTLNINCLYWVTTATLTPILRKLSNLETLYAVDTKLDLSDEDISNYKTSKKLKKLAVTVRIDSEPRGCVQSVQCLYLNLVHERHTVKIGDVFPSVSALWLETNCIATDPFVRLACLPQIRKLTVQVCRLPMFLVRDVGDLTAYYTTFRPEQKFTKCLISMPASERKIDSVLKSKREHPAWSVLEELHCVEPLGPKDSLRLFTGEVSFQDIAFEELNFHHSVCVERARQANIKILHTKNARSLKKLCIPICTFCCRKCASPRRSEVWVAGRGEKPLKRQRFGPDTRECGHSSKHFLKNCPELEELEVMACTSIESVSNTYPMSLIKELSKLKKLSVQVQVYVGSQFLPTVLEHCQQLEVLQIQSSGQNETLNHDIFKALPHAKCLKDFRYDNHNIQFDRLMESLCLLKTQKLQRIAVLCHTLDKFNCELVKPFLDENPQLVFFHFHIHSFTQANSKALQRTLNIYKKSQPWKVFIVGERNDSAKKYPMPYCHFDEMVMFQSKVATLDVFHDFCEF